LPPSYTTTTWPPNTATIRLLIASIVSIGWIRMCQA
jgi:hypothetical protein